MQHTSPIATHKPCPQVHIKLQLIRCGHSEVHRGRTKLDAPFLAKTKRYWRNRDLECICTGRSTCSVQIIWRTERKRRRALQKQKRSRALMQSAQMYTQGSPPLLFLTAVITSDVRLSCLSCIDRGTQACIRRGTFHQICHRQFHLAPKSPPGRIFVSEWTPPRGGGGGTKKVGTTENTFSSHATHYTHIHGGPTT